MRAFLGVLFLSFVGTAAAFAQAETFTVNPDRSEVAFSLGDVLHSVHGTFHVQSGSVHFDRNSPLISGSVVVAAASGKSGNDTRDRRMSENVLKAPQFAEVTFSPKHMDGPISTSGDSTVQVDGVLTLDGTPHDLTVPMQLHITGQSCTAKTHLIIPYVKWGLKDPSTFLLHVSKQVDMDITLVGGLSPAPAQ